MYNYPKFKNRLNKDMLPKNTVIVAQVLPRHCLQEHSLWINWFLNSITKMRRVGSHWLDQSDDNYILDQSLNNTNILVSTKTPSSHEGS